MPVFNWFLTQGKCQFCGYKINPVYFFIEFSVMVLSLLTFQKFGFEGLHFFIIFLGLATCMVIVTATEFTYRVVPDAVLVVAVMLAFLKTPPELLSDMIIVMVYAALAGVFYGHMYEKRMGKPLPSFAHPKLFAVSALWLPMSVFWVHFVVVLSLGLLIAIICQAKKSERTAPFAFAITASLMLHVLYPEWYTIIF
jgi:prepilin signal peptidase PulO-like enzyme (type II secretory pathway)